MNIDILRITALLDIILIHTLKSQNNFNILNFLFTFSSIGVNIFIIISGYLLLDKEENTMIFYKKRFFSIIPLYVVWNIIYTAFYKENITDIIKGYKYAAGHLWYISMISGLYIITPWLRRVLKYCEKETGIIVLMWFITCVLNPFFIYFKLPFLNLSHFPVTGFLGYYILGYYIKKYKYKINISYCKIIYIGAFLFTFAVSWFIIKTTGKKNTFFYDKNSIGVFFMSISFFAILIKKNFNRINGKTAAMLIFLSKHSYFVYLAHLFFYEIALYLTENFYLITVLCISMSYFTAYLYSKIKIKIVKLFKN